MGEGPNDQGLSRLHILNGVRDSLRRLQTDYVDLYQVHFPDNETPLDETLRALDDLVRTGLVRYIGCSNYPECKNTMPVDGPRPKSEVIAEPTSVPGRVVSLGPSPKLDR